MKINFFSITFWFNIFEGHLDLLSDMEEGLKDEFENFDTYSYTDDLVAPIISAINKEKMTNLSFSQINLQYNMDKVNSFEDIKIFKEKSTKIFDILTSHNINILHTAIFVNGEKADDDSLKVIAKNTISSKLYNEDLVDMTLKLGKKYDDLFYKIVTLLNKKQIRLPQKVDEEGRLVPIPLISWNGSFLEREIIDVSYEINDKYSFDFTKNYHTTDFHLNKMFYILSNDCLDDIQNILENGEF